MKPARPACPGARSAGPRGCRSHSPDSVGRLRAASSTATFGLIPLMHSSRTTIWSLMLVGISPQHLRALLQRAREGAEPEP